MKTETIDSMIAALREHQAREDKYQAACKTLGLQYTSRVSRMVDDLWATICGHEHSVSDDEAFFVALLNIIIANQKLDDAHYTVYVATFNDLPDSNRSSPLVDKIVKALEVELDDVGQTISWWLWDAPDAGENGAGCVTIDGENIDILTPTALYKVLTD